MGAVASWGPHVRLPSQRHTLGPLSANLPEDAKVVLEQEGKEVNSKAPY